MRRAVFVSAIVLLLALPQLSNSQPSQGENITQWTPCNIDNLFDNVDTLWMGGVFLRDTTKPLTLTLHGNEAGIRGYLYVMVPGYTDSAYYVTMNHALAGTMVDLSSLGFHHRDTIYFMYIVDISGTPDPLLWRSWINRKLYTGPNRKPGDTETEGAPVGGWLATDRYFSDRLYPNVIPCNPFANYRRFEVAGWVQQGTVNRTRTDTVAFGFEDLIIGDGDFDDVVFHTTGVYLNVPDFRPRIHGLSLVGTPNSNTISAGDSMVITAYVLMDSVSQYGVRDLISRPANDSQVRWQLSGPPDPMNPGLKYGAGPSATNTFYGARAYQTYTVTATLVDDLGTTHRASGSIYVRPGAMDHLVIEATADSAGKLWIDAPLTQLTLAPSDLSSEAFYAILRDRFGNWVSTASNPQWTVANELVVIAGPGTAPSQGRVTRQTRATSSTTVTARYQNPINEVFMQDDMLVSVESSGFHVSIECAYGMPLDNPFPCTQIYLRLADFDRSVYATVTDGFGNWVAPLRRAQWSTSDPSVVTAAVADTARAECLIEIVAPGEAFIILRDSTGAIVDTVEVVVEPPTAVAETPEVIQPSTADNCVPSGCGACGTGVELAFIPLIGLRLAGALKKRGRKRKQRA